MYLFFFFNQLCGRHEPFTENARQRVNTKPALNGGGGWGSKSCIVKTGTRFAFHGVSCWEFVLVHVWMLILFFFILFLGCGLTFFPLVGLCGCGCEIGYWEKFPMARCRVQICICCKPCVYRASFCDVSTQVRTRSGQGKGKTSRTSWPSLLLILFVLFLPRRNRFNRCMPLSMSISSICPPVNTCDRAHMLTHTNTHICLSVY